MSAVPPQGGFLSRLGGLLGGGLGDPGLSPEQQLAEQRRAAIFQAGLATLAGAQQPGATFGGSLFGGFQAGQQALQQGNQQAFSQRQEKRRDDREERLEKQESERLEILRGEAQRKQRQDSVSVLGSFGKGLEASTNPLAQFQLLTRDPVVKAGLQEYGIDPSLITTPEQAREIGQQLSALGPTAQQASRFGRVNPGQFTPESVQAYSETGDYSDLVPYVAPASPSVQMVNGVPTVVSPSRTGGPTAINPLSTQAEEEEAARRRRQAEGEGSSIGKAEGERAATFQQDLNVIDDEILRTQRLLTEFQQGKYQTGPLLGGVAGKFTTAGQDLKREAGKDVLKGISSATFGALSEGERQFLKELGVNPVASEESNTNLLTQRLQELQRTKQRLQTRGPIDVPRQGGAPSAAPQSSGGRPPLSSFRR